MFFKYTIYKITSPTGKIYIGQTKNFTVRMSCYRLENCKSQPLLYASIKKYGWDAHIVDVVDVVDGIFVDYWEEFYIRKFDSYKHFNSNGMNLTFGGYGFKGRIFSEESLRKMSESQKLKKPVSIETRSKLSKAGKGRKMSEKCLQALRDVNKGKILSEATKLKISQNLKGRFIGSKNPNSNPVLNLETGIYYECIPDAAKSANLGVETLRRYLNGIRANKTPFTLTDNIPQFTPFITTYKKVVDLRTGIIYKSIKDIAKKLNMKESTIRCYVTGHNKSKNSVNFKYLD